MAMDKDMADEIQRKVAELTQEEAVQAQAVEEPLPVAEEIKSSNGVKVAFFLAFIMFLASAATIGLMWYKNKEKPVAGSNMSSAEVQSVIKPYIDQTNKRMDGLERRMDATDKRIDVISHRQWLLGIAHNENASINEYLGKQLNAEVAGKMMFLDGDWKLNHMPSYLQLSDDDRKQLIQSVK